MRLHRFIKKARDFFYSFAVAFILKKGLKRKSHDVFPEARSVRSFAHSPK